MPAATALKIPLLLVESDDRDCRGSLYPPFSYTPFSIEVARAVYPGIAVTSCRLTVVFMPTGRSCCSAALKPLSGYRRHDLLAFLEH